METQTYVALQGTAELLFQEVAALLKPENLSPTQYNVLRILRGAGPDGLPCGEIAARMITRDPDITRLLDRMEARKLVSRSREQRDRRIITTRVTQEGLEKLAMLDEPVAALSVRQFSQVSNAEMETLLQILDKIRTRR